MFFTPRYVKEGRQTVEAARRILRYRIDLLTREEYERVDRQIEKLVEAIGKRNRELVAKAMSDLDDVVGRVAPPRSHAGWRENCEVLLVAIVIAAGVRSYIVEPFKIPTGSMQPTLNGVIAEATNTPPPNPVVRALDFALRGRTWVNLIGKENDRVAGLRERSYLNYFTFTDVICQNSKYTIFAPAAVVENQMHIGAGTRIRKDEPIFQGWVDNGDFVLVNKMAYHFVQPKNADVFVFRTTNIPYIQRGLPPGVDSQHYIKRIAGIPGNTLRIAAPQLFIDEKLAEQPAFQRVMSMKNGYEGYTNMPGTPYLSTPADTVTLPSKRYFALGDNSGHSSDSRVWGYVPEENISGKGFLVFWPFTHRWGFIE